MKERLIRWERSFDAAACGKDAHESGEARAGTGDGTRNAWGGGAEPPRNALTRAQYTERQRIAALVVAHEMAHAPAARARALARHSPALLYEWYFDGAFVPARVVGGCERTGLLTVATLPGPSLRLHEANPDDVVLVDAWPAHHAASINAAASHAGVFSDPLGFLLCATA
jgi:hypothetical protein